MSETEYQRTCQIERAEGDPAGQLSGILATDGEASDGDILDIDGGQIPKRAPLLFGHQDWSGDRNLGSWEHFKKESDPKSSKLGAKIIRGTAQIELGGSGAPQAWRDDIAHMVDRGHIGALSVRWSPVGDPIRRVNLPSDHPAFVDSQTATGNKRWGLFFPKWRLLEGSVVTLGADPAALIGRMRSAEGDVRSQWREVINRSLTECDGTRDVVAIHVGPHVGGDEHIYVERAAYDAMLEGVNERMGTVLDLFEELHEERSKVLVTEQPGKEHDVPGTNGSAGTSRSALELDVRELEFPTAVDALTEALLQALENSDERWESGLRDLVNAATGRL